MLGTMSPHNFDRYLILIISTININHKFKGIPTFYTVRAVTHVEIFRISRKHLLKPIDVPQIIEALDFCKEQPVSHLLTINQSISTTYYRRWAMDFMEESYLSVNFHVPIQGGIL